MRETTKQSILLASTGALCCGVGLAGVGNTVDCAHCGTGTTTVTYDYVTSGSSTEVETQMSCGGLPCNYGNYLVDDRLLFANPRVQSLKFVFDNFNTEYCCDNFFAINANSGETLQLSGNLGAFTSAATTAHGGLQANPLFVEFNTDVNQAYSGFQVTTVQACCNTPTDTSTVVIQPRENVTGLLMGTDDTVMLAYQRSDPTLHGSIAMEGNGPDADLFIRCGALPTDTAFDYASDSFDASEFIHLPANYCASSTIYIAVHSFSGAGMFQLMASDHIPQRHLTNMTVGVNFAPTSSELTQLQNNLTTAARGVYAASEGAIQIESFKIWKNVTCSNCAGSLCQMCIHSYTGQVSSATKCTSSSISPSAHSDFTKNAGLSEYWGIIHEMGHFLFCADDEYEANPCPSTGTANDDDCDGHTWEYECGHSIMNSNYTQNNFNYCTAYNHRLDGKSSGGNTLSAWQMAHGSSAVPPNSVLTGPGGNDTWSACDFQDRGTVPFVGRIIMAN